MHDRRDNLGVAVIENLTGGTEVLCSVTKDNRRMRALANQDVPVGHKIALRDPAVGDNRVREFVMTKLCCGA
jgi:(2R)-sulfolactate sulfo-lyase subunit alpha